LKYGGSCGGAQPSQFPKYYVRRSRHKWRDYRAMCAEIDYRARF
jgi:hypothetical protein